MAHRSSRPIAQLRERYNLTPREMARVMGITVSELHGLERWSNPPAQHLAALERLLSLHAEVRGGWRAQLSRITKTQSKNEHQLQLFDTRAMGGA